MHEMSIVANVIEEATKAAREAGASRITSVTLTIGEMTEVVPEALDFAFEALSPSTMLEGATLNAIMLSPRSKCTECGLEYDHDRFQMVCPECGSFVVEMLQGRELHIKSIDVDIDDGEAQKRMQTDLENKIGGGSCGTRPFEANT